METFRQHLRDHLSRHADKVLLRVAVADTVVELTGRAILDQATALALRYRGMPESRVVLLLLPHSTELFLLHLGLILDGRVPAILAWPTSRVDPEKYQRNLLHQLRSLPAGQLITLPAIAANMGPALPYPAAACAIDGAAQFERTFTVPLHLQEGSGPAREHVAQPPPDDALFLQFSGGTTGSQKAVVVTAPMLSTQLRRLGECLNFTADDAVVSWLPMYHDMGLIACLWLPLWFGAASLQFSATDWLLNPQSLFDYLARYDGTFCWLPNFAFAYLAAQKERMTREFSLGHVRGWINCSEPVRQRSMAAFREAFAKWGVVPTALQASYAMAENVFAVTQTALDRPPATFDRRALRHPDAMPAALSFDLVDTVYVSSGRALAGMQIRIVDGSRACEPGEPGEIQLRTECLFSGYWGAEGFVTSAFSGDGWYSTGDFGFEWRDELFVIGRLKDLVIVGGQNVIPEDVEALVNGVPGVYPGRVVAFGVADDHLGTEALAVVAELRGEYDRTQAIATQREIQKLVAAALGLAPRFVFAVPERWIVKSTAGKISRRETRARFLEERDNLLHGSFLLSAGAGPNA